MRGPQKGSGGALSPARALMRVLLIIGLVQLLPSLINDSINQISCQEFEDLNNQQQQTQGRRSINGGGNLQFAPIHQQFTSSRQFGGQPVPSQVIAQAVVAPSSSQQAVQPSQRPPVPQSTFQRTNIPTRFVPATAPASTTSSTGGFVSLLTTSSQPLPTVSGPQQAAPTVSNVEQIMKNALSRTARLEAESRQDSSGDLLQSRQGSQFQSPLKQQVSSDDSGQTTKQAQQSQQQPIAEAATPSSTDGEDRSAQTTTISSHETVYSDQRFANLFARRKTLNKAKFTPTETVKAKPTLPSFIKSPPDPKQFTASDSSESGLASSTPRQLASAGSVNPIVVRPNKSTGLAATQQQKKTNGAITSNSAATANNKRANVKAQQLSGQKNLNTKDSKSGPAAAATSKPTSNNPFSRGNNNDPSNVIAMARKRLLANNALESGKLKVQQQKPAATA